MSRILTAALAASFIAASGIALAAESHSHGAEAPAHAITLDHGKKWATDAPLREGMASIRAALEKSHGAIAKGTLPDARYAELGATIEKNVGSIVANCKLAPEADANLHVIVGELVAAADVMQGKAAGDRAQGAVKAITAVNLYGRYFDHPGFRPLG